MLSELSHELNLRLNCWAHNGQTVQPMSPTNDSPPSSIYASGIAIIQAFLIIPKDPQE